MIATVGFLGAGEMGRGMVQRLLRQSHHVVVWSRNPAKHAALQDLGAEVIDSLAETVRRADIVIGCLRDTEVTRACYLGDDGVLAHARTGLTVVEHGTFDPALAVEIADVAYARGCAFLDAPVSGGPERAASGHLVTMVGGQAAALENARPILSAYCSQITRVGAPGSGELLKLVNQLLVSVHVAVAAEASALVLREGIDPDVALQVLMGGWAASAMLERTMPRACSGSFGDSGATIGKLVEVQPLIANLLRDAGVDARMLEPARRLFTETMQAGGADLDIAALVTCYLRHSSEPGFAS